MVVVLQSMLLCVVSAFHSPLLRSGVPTSSPSRGTMPMLSTNDDDIAKRRAANRDELYATYAAMKDKADNLLNIDIEPATVEIAAAARASSGGPSPTPEPPRDMFSFLRNLQPTLALGYGWSVISLPVTFYGYIACGKVFDQLLRDGLGFNRAGGGDAFGPFITLLGLVYSVLLGQIYSYYFDRQGAIQDALYQEVGAIKLLDETTCVLAERHPQVAERRKEMQAIVAAQATQLLELGLSSEVTLLTRSQLETIRLLDAMESASGGQSRSVCNLAEQAISTISAARSERISATAAEVRTQSTHSRM